MVSAASAAERRQMQLSLRQATALALQNNLNIQIAGLTPRIREAQVTEQKGIFDVELRGRLNATDRQLLDEAATLRTADDAVIEDGVPLAGAEDTELQELSLGIQQLTPFGGTYEVEVLGTREETNRRLVPNFDTGNQVEFLTPKSGSALTSPS